VNARVAREMLRVAIVDDEPLAREGVRVRLQRAGDVVIVGECGDGDQAITLIRETKPDVVFLDIQMPGRTGIEVAQSIGLADCPYYVFITAYDAHAVSAFEVNALDYLVKPIADDRFLATLERVRATVATRDRAALAQRLGALMSDLRGSAAGQKPQPPGKLSVRVGNRIVLIAPADIDWIGAAGDYTELHVGAKVWLMRESMTALEAKLGALGFARIHRSAMVNTDRVVELKALDDGEYTVVLRDRTPLKLSRHYRRVLPILLQSMDQAT
jgi:two-component system LytT family response regulator